MKSKISLAIILVFLSLELLQTVDAATLSLTVTTTQPTYFAGRKVTINGNLALNGAPVGGLVAVQVLNPLYSTVMLRVKTTGTVSGPWLIELTQVFTCLQNGTPRSSFNRGSIAYLSVTIRNNDNEPHYAKVFANLYDSSNISRYALPLYAGEIGPGETPTEIFSMPIPTECTTGTAKIYANVLTDNPQNGGLAYAPEKIATFTITGSSTSSQSSTTQSYEITTTGSYSVTFNLPKTGVRLGTYRVYATGQYFYVYTAQASTQFEVSLAADVNSDGRVDITDISLVVAAFGLVEGDPGWNPVYDLNNDLKIDISDISIVISCYGTSGTY